LWFISGRVLLEVTLKAHGFASAERHIWEQPLAPLLGLRNAADALAPTAHAVGYSLSALRA